MPQPFRKPTWEGGEAAKARAATEKGFVGRDDTAPRDATPRTRTPKRKTVPPEEWPVE